MNAWNALTCVAICAAVAMASGCGGGDDDSSSGLQATQVRVSGKITNSTGGGISGVDIYLPFGTRQYVAQTDQGGSFSITANASEVAGLKFPVVTAYRDGYRPAQFYYGTFTGGTSYNGSTQLAAVAANESIPNQGWLLWHAGDGNYGGAVNSQFQKQPDGSVLVFEIRDFAAKWAAGYRTAVLSVAIKGAQQGLCANAIEIVQLNPAGTAISAIATQPGINAPSDGSWGRFSFTFNLASFANRPASVRFVSGRCTTSDIDDFEITGLVVTFG